MVNTVYYKIKEISTGDTRPRTNVRLDALCLELNMSFTDVKMAVTELEYLKLVKYIDATKHSVKLT